MLDDINTLQLIWFILWGVLWAIYFILDGFDFGVGMLLPVLAKDEHEKRVFYNSTGPFWDGNEVWLIAAGGATFAAFPKAYATLFSGLYGPLLILLFALIFRGVSFEFRKKVDNPGWRKMCDVFHFFGNFVPALLLGVAFANLFQGLHLDVRGVHTKGILDLLNVYGIAGGVLFVTMFCLHGSLWLAIRSEGELRTKAMRTARIIWPFLLALICAFFWLTSIYTNLYANYTAFAALYILPILAVAAYISVYFGIKGDRPVFAWACSSLFIFATTLFGVAGMFPSLIPAKIAANSITISKAASSDLTLTIMLVVALLFVPLVIAYQAWALKVFSFKITPKDLEDDHAY